MPEWSTRDLVVLSHLPWDGVWQRPNHVVSRLARGFRRTWFVEEPSPVRGGEVRLTTSDEGGVTRVRVEVPSTEAWLPFGEPESFDHAGLLRAVIGGAAAPVVWLYTPMALPLAQALQPGLLVFDVMDDLSSFRGAPPQMRLRHVQSLAAADVVFTGGRSLHERVLQHRQRPARTLCLPSGVEAEHFRRPRTRGAVPVAGYVGVIDERLDLDLVAELAARLPDWRIRMVGPVCKIDAASLPSAPNIEYWGKRAYAELPEVMAGFDVALMPFALNEATASISPTKTLEYLAAGLPVVSTRVRDVVRDHGEVVMLAATAEETAQACRAVREDGVAPPRDRVAQVLREQSWDAIVARMEAMLEGEPDEARESA